MDNEFGDDDGLRQARSRRRFQTGLVIFLLLFFMDARTPQETQNRGKRAAQARTSAKNQEVTRTTVHRLAEDLLDHIVPRGPTYALRSSSTIKGEWRQSDAESFRTVVPTMTPADPSEGSGSKHRLDLRDEAIVPIPSNTETAHFSHSRMTASLVQAKGNPEVSMVHGTLNVGGVTTKSGVDTLFEGLFFHKYGHMSAVVGASGDELKVVWTPAANNIPPTSPAGVPGGGVPPSAAAAAAPPPPKAETLEDNSVGGGDRLTSGIKEADKGGESRNSTASAVVSVASSSGSSGSGGGGGGDADGGSTNPVVVQTTTGPPPAEEMGAEDGGEGGGDEAVGEEEEEEDGEGNDSRGRRALGGGGRVSGDGRGVHGDGGREGGSSLELRWGGLGSTEQAARDARSMGGWLWREKEGDGEERVVGEDGAGVSGGRRRALDGSGRPGDFVRHQVTPQQQQEGDEAEPPCHQKETPAGSRPSLLPRHLDDGTGVGAGAAAAAATELDASVTEEAREGAADEGEAETALTREFPAMVVPKVAVATAGQESGPLPSQWYNLRKEYGQGCLFLLTLQTVEDDEDGDDDGTTAVVGEEGGDEAANARKPLADLMRGEMVGVNCDFSAVIEVQLSPGTSRTSPSQAVSYSVVFTMVCLLQMCFLCCRVGLMLAQRRYGRNFMVPRRFQPPKFDYHRPIPPELLEQAETETAGGQPSEESRDLEAGNCLECTICYAAVDGELGDYMLTPCDHVFHQGCLTRWMDIKTTCPTCRQELPPALER